MVFVYCYRYPFNTCGGETVARRALQIPKTAFQLKSGERHSQLRASQVCFADEIREEPGLGKVGMPLRSD